MGATRKKPTAKAKPKSKVKTTRTKLPAPRVKQAIRNMKGGNVIGELKAGRVIMGNQYNYTAPVASPQAFVAELQKLQAQIAELKQAKEATPAIIRRIEVVEGDVQDAVAEAQKPQPAADSINRTLTGAKETMDNLSGSLQSALKLGAVVAGLGHLAAAALRVFGG